MGRSQSRRPILAEQQEFPARLAPPEQAGLIIPQSPGVNPNLSVSPAASASRHNPLPTAEASTAASVRDTRLQAAKARASALGNLGETQIREIACARPRSFTPVDSTLMGPWGMPSCLLATLSQNDHAKMLHSAPDGNASSITQATSETLKSARVNYFRNLGKNGGGLSYFLNPPRDPSKQVGLLISGRKHIIQKTLLDFGSNISLLGSETAKSLGLTIYPSPLTLTTSNEVDSAVMGCTDVIPISYGDGENEVITHHSFLVAKEHPGLP